MTRPHPAPPFRLALALLLATALPAAAQGGATAHTLTADGAPPPPATLADAAWLVGAWEGEGLGGWNEEVWSAPAGGAMMGVFRHVKDGAVVFYEFMTLVETDGSLELRIKHFHPDMRGWEEKDDMVRFPLVRADAGTLWFDGLTLRRNDDDTMDAWVAFGSGGEGAFHYRRVQGGGGG